MAASPEMWNAFVEHLDGMIAERRALLRPLLDGKVRSGRRGPDTNGEWIDTTDANIQRLENEITSLQHTIDRVKKEDLGDL